MASSSSHAPAAPHRIAITRLAKRLTITVQLDDGQPHLLVETTLALILAESGYPIRYYFPKDAIQAPFRPVLHAGHETYCPYKGFASYYHLESCPASPGPARRVDDLFWSYPHPFPGSHAKAVAGLLCLDAPSDRCRVKVDGRSVSLAVARELSEKILDASSAKHPSASPRQPRPTAAQRSDLEAESRARPALPRIASSQPQPPTHTLGFIAAVDLQLDSADPLLADLVYRLDDERHPPVKPAADADGDGIVPGEPSQGGEPGGVELDPHLAWFRDYPWYRRPSDKWLRLLSFLLALAMGMCIGPRLALFNALVCQDVLGDSVVGVPILGSVPVTSAGHVASMVSAAPYQSWPELSTSYDDAAEGGLPYSLMDVAAAAAVAATASRQDGFAFGSAADNTGVEEPKRPSKLCLADPEVQSSVAALQLRLTLSTGLLAVLTTGFWSSLSSRLGRLFVLRFAILGFLCSDIVTMAVALVPRSQLPGGINFLLLGSTIEGLFGGYSTAIAVHQLYISDATPSGTRAHIFAHFMGILSAGIGIGPTLGGMLVQRTGKILSPFYFAFGTHVLYAIFAYFIIPESSSAAARQKAKEEHEASRIELKRRAEERKAAAEEVQPLLDGGRNEDHSAGGGKQKPWKKRVWRRIKVAFVGSIFYAPLEPVALLLPKKVRVVPEEEQQQRAGVSLRSELAHPEASASHISVSRVPEKMRYDTNLFFLSLTYFVETTVYGIMSYKMQYAQQRYLWDSAQLGVYLSFVGLTRVVSLGLVLPVVIKLLHQPVEALTLPHDGVIEGEYCAADELGFSERRRSVLDAEGRAVVPDVDAPSPHYGTFATAGDADTRNGGGTSEWDAKQKGVEELWTMRAKHLRLIHDSKFDLKLAKVSIVINTVSYIVLVFSTRPALFFVGSALTSLGGGGSAAMSSLALALLESPSDAGKLFGAWSILSAIASTVVGPLVFAQVYEATTRVFSGAIFVVGTAMFIVSFVTVCMVKVRQPLSLPSLPARPPLLARYQAARVREEQDGGEEEGERVGTWKGAFSLRMLKGEPAGNRAKVKGKGRTRMAMPFGRR
ncbi:hypothetical protein ACQY0O_004977 [Thecaphora frezii]